MAKMLCDCSLFIASAIAGTVDGADIFTKAASAFAGSDDVGAVAATAPGSGALPGVAAAGLSALAQRAAIWSFQCQAATIAAPSTVPPTIVPTLIPPPSLGLPS